MVTEATELTVFTESTAVAVFSGGIDAALQKIATEARAQAVDISTKKGRQECASLAYRVARSKTAIDEAGVKLSEDARKKIDAINADRKKAREFLDSLKDEVRKPLTDWEERDVKRVALHESQIEETIRGGDFTLESWRTLSVEAMRDRMAEIITGNTRNWEEFDYRAKREIQQAAQKIELAIERRLKADAEAAEQERLRLEEQARVTREREERIAAEAAAKAKAEAERKAEAEARAVAAEEERKRKAIEKKIVEERIESERQRISAEQLQKAVADAALKEKEEAERRAAEAQQMLIASELTYRRAAEKAEADRIAAEERAAKRQAEALEQERATVAAEAKAKEEVAAKREADLKHRAKINKAAMQALVSIGLTELVAQEVIVAIYNGKVPNVKVTY